MIDGCIVKQGLETGESMLRPQRCVCVCVFATWLFVKWSEAGYVHCFGSQGLQLSCSVLICFPLTQQTHCGQTHTHAALFTNANGTHTRPHALSRWHVYRDTLTTQTLHKPTILTWMVAWWSIHNLLFQSLNSCFMHTVFALGPLEILSGHKLKNSADLRHFWTSQIILKLSVQHIMSHSLLFGDRYSSQSPPCAFSALGCLFKKKLMFLMQISLNVLKLLLYYRRNAATSNSKKNNPTSSCANKKKSILPTGRLWQGTYGWLVLLEQSPKPNVSFEGGYWSGNKHVEECLSGRVKKSNGVVGIRVLSSLYSRSHQFQEHKGDYWQYTA